MAEWPGSKEQTGERSHQDVDGRECMGTMMHSSLALLTVEFVHYACVIV